MQWTGHSLWSSSKRGVSSFKTRLLISSLFLFRSGSFECHPELTCYRESLMGGSRRRHRQQPVRGSPPLPLLAHDMDDAQPPSVSYASAPHSLDSESEGSEEDEEGRGEAVDLMTISQYVDWEHLDPSIEELREFEEEQMRQALTSAKSVPPPMSSEQHRVAQEAEIYRERLRRLDYNSTYMDYAALTATGSAGAGVSPGDSIKSSSGGGGEKSSPEPTPPEAPPTTQASGIFGTLSSLWTSTFWGSKS